MIRLMRTVIQYRELLGQLMLRDVKARYRQAVLGVAWAVLQPFAMMVVFTLIFAVFAKLPSDGVPYPLFAYAALVPWLFFANALTLATLSLVQHRDLVTKIYFPREILVLAAMLGAFADFCITFVVFFVMAWIYGLQFSHVMWGALLLIVIQMLLTFGLGCLSAIVCGFFRDLRHAVPLVLQLWMFATPVFYPLTLVPEQWRALYLLNPMALLISGYKQVLLHQTLPPAMHLFTAFGMAIALCLVGYSVFKRFELEVADII